MKIPESKVIKIPQGIQLGEQVKFYKRTTGKTGDNKIWYQGIVHGYDPRAYGGKCFFITNVRVVEPKTMKVDADKIIKIN